jgi:hypothetical protein
MKNIKIILPLLMVLLIAPAGAVAGGPFGTPEPIAKQTGGLHTGIGYWFHEDKYNHGTEQITRQNQVYSELGYGSRDGWELTARIGVSDLKLIDAFRSSTALTATSKTDFTENWKFFSTVGAKGFYPFSKAFGMGAFVQGTYYFGDFTDTVSGTRSGIPFSAELRVKNLWDVNLGMGFQATAPGGIRMYIGPYVHYSEFKVSPSANIAGLPFASGDTTIKNKTGFGGFAGIDFPLAKGFHLNLEGRFTERLSAGAAVTYVY